MIVKLAVLLLLLGFVTALFLGVAPAERVGALTALAGVLLAVADVMRASGGDDPNL